jgi:PAS domain S-box-containing protein
MIAQVEAAPESGVGAFRTVVEETMMPTVVMASLPPDHPIVYANDAFVKWSGYGREEVLGRSCHFMMRPDSEPAPPTPGAPVFTGRLEDGPETVFRRKDGSEAWAVPFICPILDGAGRATHHFASFRDVTRRRKAEARVQRLMEELDHRVNNMLARVQSIAAQTQQSNAADSPAWAVFEARLVALSNTQNLLAPTEGTTDGESASLRELLTQELAPHDDGGQPRFALAGADVRLRPKLALALGMVFHELATNAASYGALSNRAGQIRVAWDVSEPPAERRLRLGWTETGGPPVERPRRKGFGSRLIERSLAYELDAEVRLDYAPGGVACSIDVPVGVAG